MKKNQKYKQVIIIRNDQRIPEGKRIVQACHAATESLIRAMRRDRKALKRWRAEYIRKILIGIDNEQFTEIYNKLNDTNLPYYLVMDLELKVPTAIGIGPVPSNEVDKITGGLPLFKGEVIEEVVSADDAETPDKPKSPWPKRG